MTKYVALFIVAASILAGALMWSQQEQPPRKVSGIVEADEIRLGSRVGGRVAKVFVTEGERVKAGTVLVELEPFELDEREAEARSKLQIQKAERNRLVAGFRPEEIAQAKARYDELAAKVQRLVAGPRRQEIEASKAELDAALAQLELAQQGHARIKRIFDQDAATREDLDRAIEVLKSAKAMALLHDKRLELLTEGTRQEEIDEAKAQLDTADQAWRLAHNGYRQEEKDKAEAAVLAANAALNALIERKKELQIIAPVDGTIEALELQRGDLTAADAPVLSMMDTGKLWVRAYVPENWLDLNVGRRVEISIDSFPGERFAAHVSFIARQAEFTPANVQTPEERSKQVFRIRATLSEGLDRLRPGMGADVWLDRPGASP